MLIGVKYVIVSLIIDFLSVCRINDYIFPVDRNGMGADGIEDIGLQFEIYIWNKQIHLI